MPDYLFRSFRRSRLEYEMSIRFWSEEVWDRIPPYVREGWTTPWFARQRPELEDGNPIFSAWSPYLHRGIQIVQIEPG